MKMSKLKLAIIGTNGVPNQYGGFETLVEYLAQYLSNRFDITIYCSRTQNTRVTDYKGCKLKYLPLSANGAQGILFDVLSLILTARKFDRILVLGCSAILTMRILKRYGSKFILNIGGIDWRRSKWGPIQKWLIRTAEKTAIPICSKIISDNEGIREYILDTYGKDSYMIEYGGDQVTKELITAESIKKYPFLENKYALVVARIQSDNNIEMSIKGCIQIGYPLVVIGNWKSSKYGVKLREKFKNEKNLFLLDAIYDQKELNILRSNAAIYIHGHSGGGTNPSLLEIMHLEVPVLCYNSNYNRYTTEGKAKYFNDAQELTNLLKTISEFDCNLIKTNLFEVAKRRYCWNIIAEKYAEVIEK